MAEPKSRRYGETAPVTMRSATDRAPGADQTDVRSASGLLWLQGAVGNRAVAKGLADGTVQRLPAAAALKSELGGASRFSHQYKALLAQLDHYSRAMTRPLLPEMNLDQDPSRLKSDAKYLDEVLEGIIESSEKFVASKKNDKRAPRIADLKRAAVRERAQITMRVGQLSEAVAKGAPLPQWTTWRDVVTDESASSFRNVSAEGGKASGKDKGGINEVTKYSFASGEAGFFKASKASVDDKDQDGYDSTEKTITSTLGIPQNLKKPGEEGFDIDKAGPRFTERSVAMSRIDQILNAGVIARTEFAVVKGGDGMVAGQLMAAAKGETLPKLDQSNRIANNQGGIQAKKDKGAKGNVLAINDPNLQRLMSKLDIVDSLCGQYDRHAGNFFVEVGEDGQASSVTGIDNDLSFPTQNFTVGKGGTGGMGDLLNYEGIGKYVDIEIAEAVLRLTPTDLKLVLADLLTESEIAAAIGRLEALQAILRQKQSAGELLRPGQWNDSTMTKQKKTPSQGYHGRYAQWDY